MPSYGHQVAPRDKTAPLSITRLGDDVLPEPIELEVYVNRLTGRSVPVELNGHAEELTDAEVTNYRNAADLVHMIASWNVTGPVPDAPALPYGEHDTLPLTPEVVQYLDLRFRQMLTTAIVGAVFPNPPSLPGSRRR